MNISMKHLNYVSAFFILSFQHISAHSLVLPSDFHKAMVSCTNDQPRYETFLKATSHTHLLEVIQKQYYAFCETAAPRVDKQMRIPKIIHQIWIGPARFPEEARAWSASWRTAHPDWEYILWTDKEVKKLKFQNKKYFNKAKNWGEKADILRYELLHQFGGVYVDVDFECLKNFDDLNALCDFYTGIHAVPLLFGQRLRINNGIIACSPRHPIMKHAVNQIKHFRDKKDVAKRTGPDFFTKIIEDVLPTSLASGSVDMVFPSNFFYPSGPTQGAGFTIKPNQAYVQPETMAVHYYTAYWIKNPEEKIKPENTHTSLDVALQSTTPDTQKPIQVHKPNQKPKPKLPKAHPQVDTARLQSYKEKLSKKENR